MSDISARPSEFEGDLLQTKYDAQAAAIKALVEALECIDNDLESRNFLESSSLRDTTRAALAAAKKYLGGETE